MPSKLDSKVRNKSPSDGDRDVVDNRDADRRLLKRVTKGDRNALAALYDNHATRLLNTAYSILHCQADAEDLIHDVFVEAWQKSASYKPEKGSVYYWLLMRVRSRAIDRLRTLKVAQNHAMLQKPLGENRQASTDHSALSADSLYAKQALDSLSQVQRQVIELGYFQGLTCREIAGQCGLPLGTVKSRLASAVVKLRQHIAPELETP